MQRLLPRPRLAICFLVIAFCLAWTNSANAQQCSDQQCEYSISIVPVLDILDDDTLPVTVWLDRTVVNTCSGTLVTT